MLKYNKTRLEFEVSQSSGAEILEDKRKNQEALNNINRKIIEIQNRDPILKLNVSFHYSYIYYKTITLVS